MSFLKDLVLIKVWSIFVKESGNDFDERIKLAEMMFKDDVSPGRALANALDVKLYKNKKEISNG